MASTIVLPQGTYPTGTRTGTAPLAQGITDVELLLAGAAMTDPALHVTLTLDLSLDNGATFNPHPAADPFPVSCELVGGAKNRLGQQTDYMLGTGAIPHPELSTRRLRATIVIAGASLTTQATVVTS